MNRGESTIINDINERINNLYMAAVSISPLHAGQPKEENTERFNGILSEMADLKRQAVMLSKNRRDTK